MEAVKPSEIKLEIDNLGYHGYYLPHHAVYKEESSTTKFRVVFNGSQKSLSGVSLNDKLLVGPNIQENMTSILLRWRFFRIAFSADIEKMYRQVKIHYPHTDFQRIIWRESKLNPLQDYRLLTVTFGIDCSAYLAIRVLKKLAADEKIKFPIGSNVLENDFYVDNLLSGADNACKAIEKRDQLMSLLKEGSFTLRKWVCNQESVLAGIPNEFREVKEHKFVNLDTPVKALGLYWSPQTDEFQYKVKFSPRTDSPTKRTILSDISKLFDPLGWISPVIVKGKMIMQSLWLSGLNWDVPISEEILNQWINFTAQFSRLEDIRIPRWINYLSTYNYVEIHVFSDASNQAFCAALYIRLKENDRWISHLLIAKTRIAPLKPISLPRLELCGALLAAKLTSQILSSLAVPVQTIYAWTDSTIVLSWLKEHPSKWKTFVSNRVAEIQELSKNTRWNFIPSSSNPADLGTRGISSTELLKGSLWFYGPKWLSSDQDTWPKPYDYDSTTMEQKRVSLHSSIQSVELADILKRYSSITKLNRVIAYCVRFIRNCKISKIHRKVNYLSADELKRALVLIIKLDQAQYFSEEIANLKDGKGLPTKSKILSLTPFLDHQGILRVGGRLKNSNLSYHEIHPIILSNQSNIATLLIRKAHLDTLHGGCQLIMRKLRERYWILNLRRTVRKLIHSCIACYRQKATAAQQLMGNLPYPRITPSRPFTHTGVDYCGPFEIKQHKGRNAKITKCYVSLFICLSVKAIHLELVSDLTTEAFLAAFKRFCARRGLCSHVYSDQGTNFKGASTVIKNDFKRAIKNAEREVAEILANDEITWHFIPPSSPHFGGLWEAGVKSVKFHLRRIVKSLNFTFEEMYTLLAQIEATLNSRPLCPLNSDPEDVSPLTPNHFLIGGSTSSPPEPTLLDVAENRLNRWQKIQKVHQNFWQSWRRDYLNRLHTRPKWLQTKTNIEKNQLVLLKDERLPPNKWLLGRIVETHPGKDGLTRVVTLRTKDSFLIRPITKLCVLPSNS